MIDIFSCWIFRGLNSSDHKKIKDFLSSNYLCVAVFLVPAEKDQNVKNFIVQGHYGPFWVILKVEEQSGVISFCKINRKEQHCIICEVINQFWDKRYHGEKGLSVNLDQFCNCFQQLNILDNLEKNDGLEFIRKKLVSD